MILRLLRKPRHRRKSGSYVGRVYRPLGESALWGGKHRKRVGKHRK